jgi:RNA ligase
MKITELFSLEALELELQDGFVKEQKHPTLPLTILNYTDKATYERRWNDVTMHCRGLIVHRATHEVVSRGPRKFFNYGEPSAASYPLDTQVRLTRKEDGSLGIGWYYVDPDEFCFYGYATRGSFTSDQAVWANEHFMANKGHDARYEILPDVLMDYSEGNVLSDDSTKFTGRPSTDIVEIVYAENRIVLDYGDREELIPLGMVDNKSGLIVWRPNTALVEGKPAILTLAEALALPIPDDEEGYVLDILDEYLNVVDHLKLKGDRYKELHAAIFGLSEKAVWEQMQAGTINEFLEALPDEVQPWAEEVTARLWREHDALYWRVLWGLNAVAQNLPLGYSRKDAALYLRENYPDVMSPVFNLLDGKYDRRSEWIWKQIKPGHVPFSSLTSEKLANNKTLESASI